MVVASALRQPQVQLPTPHAPPQCHPPVCWGPRCSRCWLPGRNARLQPTTRYRPCHSPPATPVRRSRTHIGQHTCNASLLGVMGRCLTSSGPTSPATSSHPPPPVPKRGTAAIHPRGCRGSRPTPATWLRTARLGPTPTWRTQHNEGVAARRYKRMPHHFPSRTPLLFGTRKPSTPGVPMWPTRKQTIHHHPVPRRHHLRESPFQDLAPPPPSAPYSPNRQPLPVPSRSWPLRRPPRSLCPIRDFTEPSRAFGTSYSQDVPGGRTRVTTNTLLTDLNIEHSTRPDARRIEVIANGLTLWGGTQLAIDTALVSPLTRDGQPRRRALRFTGAVLQDARRRKERTYPELIGSRRCRFVVLAIETGGRWSEEASMFVRLLAQAKARQAPPLLQTSLAAALISRWTASLSHAAMHAFAASLLAQDCSNHANVDGNQPTLSQVLAEAPLHATNPSRLPARSSGAPAAWRLTSKTVLVRDSRGKKERGKKKPGTAPVWSSYIAINKSK